MHSTIPTEEAIQYCETAISHLVSKQFSNGLHRWIWSWKRKIYGVTKNVEFQGIHFWGPKKPDIFPIYYSASETDERRKIFLNLMITFIYSYARDNSRCSKFDKDWKIKKILRWRALFASVRPISNVRVPYKFAVPSTVISWHSPYARNRHLELGQLENEAVSSQCCKQCIAA
jgi:hypothetical protein